MANRVSIFIELKDRFTRGIKRAQSSFQRFTKSINVLGAAVTGTIAIGLISLGRHLRDLTANAGEAESAVNAVLPEVENLDSRIQNLAKSTILTTRQTNQLVTAISAMGKSAGATQEEAFKLSEFVIKTGADLASFSNAAGGTEQAVEALRSAFNNEREALKTLNITISDNDVKRKAQELGLISAGQEASQLGTILATLALIEEKLGDSTGDVAATFGSLANQVRLAKVQNEELQTELADNMAPTMNLVTDLTNRFFKGLNLFVAPGGVGKKVLLYFVQLSKILFNVATAPLRLIHRLVEAIPLVGKAIKEHLDIPFDFVNEKFDSAVQGIITSLEEERAEIDKLNKELADLNNNEDARAEEQKRRAQEFQELLTAFKDLGAGIGETTKEERDLQSAIKQGTTLWEQYNDAIDSGTASTKSFAKQARELREQEQQALQSIPDRLSAELIAIRDEREGLYQNLSISRGERKRELDELKAREEAVNRLIKERGITEEQISDAATRANRPAITREIEQIESRIADIRDDQRELDERADKAKIDNLKAQLKIVQDIYETTKKTARVGGSSGGGLSRTSPGRAAFERGALAPSFGNLGLRNVRSERE